MRKLRGKTTSHGERVDCVVVGAGVLGLAAAGALARAGREVIVLEANAAIGTEISSRNSGVIHAGIYYPKDSVKARACVTGKKSLYAFCEAYGVAHQRIEKLLVATDESQLPLLRSYQERAAGNGVDDLRYLTAAEARALEPEVRCSGALLSPSTGILDVHAYMLALQGDAEEFGAVIAFNTPLLGGRVGTGETVVEAGGEQAATLACRLLVNCAGLGAQAVAGSIDGFPEARVPRLYLAKGNYFSLNRASPFRRLIYPMPVGAWLGVHSVLDMGGRCKFGPDIHWVNAVEYDVDAAQAEAFYPAIRRYWPDLPDGALQPDYAGLRPKLYREGETPRDFLIQGPDDHGVAGIINLFGIESPGLTASLAIADEVAQMAARDAPLA
jgi:L-2-hydroxyglutarate oxidase LhgO